MNSELFNKRYISLGQVHFNDLSKEIQVASYEIDTFFMDKNQFHATLTYMLPIQIVYEICVVSFLQISK